MVNVGKYTPPKINVSTKEWTISKYVIQPLIFMRHVFFWGGIIHGSYGICLFYVEVFLAWWPGKPTFYMRIMPKIMLVFGHNKKAAEVVGRSVGGKRCFFFSRFLAFVDALFFAIQMSLCFPRMFFLDMILGCGTEYAKWIQLLLYVCKNRTILNIFFVVK